MTATVHGDVALVPGDGRRPPVRDPAPAAASPSTRPSATVGTSSRGRLHRRPSHLHDRHATVYRWPHMAPGSDLITDRRLHPLSGPDGRRLGWLVRRRRLPEVHPLHGVQRRPAVHERPPPGPPGAGGPDRPRRATGCAGSAKMWDAQAQHPLPPGGDRLRQPCRHVPRRPRPLAPAAGRRPRPRPPGPLRLPPPRPRGRSGRTPDQPQPGRPGRGRVRPGRPGRRLAPPVPRPPRAAAGAAPLREGRDRAARRARW